MAGTKTASASRGKYSTAGYMGEEKDLYISRVPAGSAQDDLQDLNKPGYRVARPWNESPEPVLTNAERMQPLREKAARKEARPGFVAYWAREAKRDRGAAICCVILLCVSLTMIALACRQLGEGKALAQEIQVYQNGIDALEAQNEAIEKQLAAASSGERIRNLAQNDLGMLRPERADRQTIYISAPNQQDMAAAQEDGEPQLDILDIALGLLHVLNIGE